MDDRWWVNLRLAAGSLLGANHCAIIWTRHRGTAQENHVPA